MNKIYSRPKAVYFAAIGVVFLALLLPLRTTLVLAGEYGDLRERIEKLQELQPITPADLNRRKLFKNSDNSNTLFSAMTNSCRLNNVLIRKFHAPKTSISDGVGIFSQSITIEGTFVDILKTTDEVANKIGALKIASMKFEREQKGRSALVLHIVFQTVKPTENENE